MLDAQRLRGLFIEGERAPDVMAMRQSCSRVLAAPMCIHFGAQFALPKSQRLLDKDLD
jgi:hypothetical protein